MGKRHAYVGIRLEDVVDDILPLKTTDGNMATASQEYIDLKLKQSSAAPR